MRKYLTEFIGTFFLVFTICISVQTKAALAPLAIGLVLAAMVFAGGHVSGAHYNPAVTLAVYLRGKLPASDIAPYMGAQILGAVAAASISRVLLSGLPAVAAFHVSGRALVAALTVEVLVTFALAYVVLSVATSKDHPNNSFYGLAIGFTVLAGAVTVGGISGGVFNPAVAIGVSVAGMVSWSMIWVYLTANLAGGALAAVAFRYLNPADLATPTEAAPPAAAPRRTARRADEPTARPDRPSVAANAPGRARADA
jgi:aquaporin Z